MPWIEDEMYITALAEMPNINQLASGSADKKIRLWD